MRQPVILPAAPRIICQEQNDRVLQTVLRCQVYTKAAAPVPPVWFLQCAAPARAHERLGTADAWL